MCLILNDGTVIENGQAWNPGGVLRCFFDGYTIEAAATLFFDPTKTERITFQSDGTEEVFEGYTDCTGIELDAQNYVHVSLRKGAET